MLFCSVLRRAVSDLLFQDSRTETGCLFFKQAVGSDCKYEEGEGREPRLQGRAELPRCAVVAQFRSSSFARRRCYGRSECRARECRRGADARATITKQGARAPLRSGFSTQSDALGGGRRPLADCNSCRATSSQANCGALGAACLAHVEHGGYVDRVRRRS